MPSPVSIQAEEFQRELDAGNLRRAGAWLVEHCARDVIGLCTAMVRDRAMAEDLAQDAFGKAFSSLRTFRGEASPRTWLLAIARNQCLDHLRRQKHERLVESHDTDPGEAASSDAPLPAELLGNRAEVARALDSLDEVQRAMVILRFCQGSSYDELAVIFGINTGTARMRVSRALARMREALEESPQPAMQPALARGGVLERRSRAETLPGPAPAAAMPARRAAQRTANLARPPSAAPRAALYGPPPAPGAAPASSSPSSAASVFAETLSALVPPLSTSTRARLASLVAAIR